MREAVAPGGEGADSAAGGAHDGAPDGCPDGAPDGTRDGLRLLAVHAHPDDESSKGAATMARYVSEGVDVLVVTCTGGEAGSILNPAMDTPGVRADLASVRRAEMERAREILGVRQAWLGFRDSGLPEAGDDGLTPPLHPDCFAMQPLEVATEALVRIVRDFRPQVITTYDETGGYPHPDHVMTHRVALEAFEAAGDPARYPDAGEPWQPLKLYYHLTFHKRRLSALHEAITSTGAESPYTEWLAEWVDKPEDDLRLTTRVEAAAWFPVRDAALLAHATQVDPTGNWFRVPVDLQKRTWPTEDYQLARSLVSDPAAFGPDAAEDDLFAGIRVVSRA